MGGKSSIQTLPDPVRLEVDAAIKRGATIDEIVWMLKGLGADVSRSAVGRYSKQYADLAARQRDMSSIATAFAGEFGEADNLQGRLLIQLVTTIATRMAMPLASGEEIDTDAKELHFLARAIKDITSASKTDVDREAAIAKRVRERAAIDAVGAARDAGADDETCRRVRAKILGLDLPAKETPA